MTNVEKLSSNCAQLQVERDAAVTRYKSAQTLLEDNANLSKTISNMTITAAELKAGQASLLANSAKLKTVTSMNEELKENIRELGQDLAAQKWMHEREKAMHAETIVKLEAKLEQEKATHAQEVEKIKAEAKEALDKANAAVQQAVTEQQAVNQQVQEVVVLRKELQELRAKVRDVQECMKLERETNDELLTELDKAFFAREATLKADREAAIASSKELESQAARKDHEVALQAAKVKDLEQVSPDTLCTGAGRNSLLSVSTGA